MTDLTKLRQVLKDFSLEVGSLNPYTPEDIRYTWWPEMSTLVVAMLQDRIRAEEAKDLPDAEGVETKLAEEANEQTYH